MGDTVEQLPLDRRVRFLYREHRGSLADSMKTVKEFHSKDELIKHLQRGIAGNDDCSNITIKKYGNGIDERIGWDTHIVTLNGYGVLGFTDRAVET